MPRWSCLGFLFSLLLCLDGGLWAIDWPISPSDVSYPIGNSYGEYQYYGGEPYYHPGIDIMAPALARARAEAAARGLVNAGFTLGELERMPFGDGQFTGAACRFSFHHFVNPGRVFAEMARAVGPRGWMIIADMTASEDAAKAALHNELERLSDPTHARTLAASEFEGMFAAHGFRTVMKIARDARTTVDEWIGFNHTPPDDAARIRELIEGSLDGDRAGLRAMRDGDTIRTIRTSVTFVIERE